ncbi:MAG: 23S rRNA (adenine(2503)-C(2))-methyltransferase RlmN [Candidatus Omnitrophica bacterium]|nr:23S rRNA (adenine(2503)-C(2))-methyltransferase RlmN [Candidatus Omnitrophota bacterium]
MDKTDIKNLSKDGLVSALKSAGAEAYRAKQVFRWLYASGARSFDGMSDLPDGLRHKLKGIFHITRLTMLDSRKSKADGTTKYLLKLEDANAIEAVFLPEEDRASVCLSTQVGCRFACAFCASAPFGFIRNLKASEILDEVLFVRADNPRARITNLVFMGIGEPLDNYDNLLKAIRILNDPDAFNIGARRMTISTCGIIPGMKKLEREALQVELSVSLHSADEEVRSKLVPINNKYPLKELIPACREYTGNTGRVITFEYILIKGANASRGDALKLAKLLKGINCKVNTIACNKVSMKGYAEPSSADIRVFVRTLRDNGINVNHRKPRGEDIDAGCGQLRISRYRTLSE